MPTTKPATTTVMDEKGTPHYYDQGKLISGSSLGMGKPQKKARKQKAVKRPISKP